MAPKDKNFPMAGKMGGMGGKYGRKAENLTAKELKKAGGAKASAARKVDISQTRRDTTRGITLGPKGQPLTGKVVLANGNVAVYKAGKRVVAAAAAKKSSGGDQGKATPPAKKVSSYTPGKKQGAGSRSAELRNQGKASKAASPMSALRGNKAGSKSGASSMSSSVKDKGPRKPGESVQAYNDRIRNAPLADIISKFKFGTSGKTVNSGKGPYSK